MCLYCYRQPCCLVIKYSGSRCCYPTLLPNFPPSLPAQQWHRRYFVLLKSKIMEYYTSHERKPQDYLKSIDLSRCEDMIAPLPVTGRLHVIKLSVKIGAKLRDYFLDCSTEENMNSWVTALAKTCGFCPGEWKWEAIDDYHFKWTQFCFLTF